jgi:hypothetical protein
MGLQARALTEQQELGKANLVHRVDQMPPRLLEGGRRAPDDLVRPLQITGPAVSRLQGAEQCVIVKPVGLVVAELFEGRLQVRSRAGPEVPPGRLEQRVLEPLDDLEVDGRRGERDARTVARPHQSVFDQPVGADEERVAGEGRQ